MKSFYAMSLSIVCAAGVASGADLNATPTGSVGNDLGTVYEEVPSYRELTVNVRSGDIRIDPSIASNEARAPQVAIWSQVVEIDDADWVRLRFSDVVLAKSTEQTRESYIRISSLEDGYEQYLDVDSLTEWSNTSAYFNGNRVLVELMASPNLSNQFNRIQVSGAQVSDPVSSRSICFSTDDRVLSDDPRDARMMPVGCSVWLFGEHGSCFITAGHCGASQSQVVQFNVPLSSSGGGTRNPPPQDQYVIDGSSVQTSSSIFIGNDWSFFGTFDNSTTGLSPLSAQGASHTLANSLPPVDGRPIRITGYGTTSSPIPGSWNQVQKTHVGPLTSISGNTVQYQTDTTGGNSGSAIEDDSNDTVIGIHTNAGCGSSGGANQGTSLFNSGLQNALANPLGICTPRSIQASLLFQPTFVSPSGGDVLTLNIDNLQGHSVVGSPTMFVDSGSGFVGSSMVSAGSGTYEGVFSATPCGNTISYYLTIEDEEGTIVSIPASGAYQTVALDDLTIGFEDDFEDDLGWVAFTLGGSGSFIRAVPANHGLGDPASDADGSGKCYVTSNNNGIDVDNGSVALMSPVVDVFAIDQPTIEMSVWMVGTAPSDTMKIEFTNNVGVSWVPVETLSNTNGWEPRSYVIEEYISLTPGFRMRVTVTDGGANTTVEAGIDGFLVASKICNDSCPADLNGDGTLDFFDVSAFLSAFSSMDPSADFDDNGTFDFFDVSGFLSAFSAGCP